MLTLFLSKVIGLWVLVAGIALLRNPLYIRDIAIDIMSHKGNLYIGGVIAFFLGLLITISHNVWVLDWPVLITLIGWTSLIKGTFFTVFPDYAEGFGRWYLSHVPLRPLGVLYCLLGLFLCWLGFGLA